VLEFYATKLAELICAIEQTELYLLNKNYGKLQQYSPLYTRQA
jgi:hypothetical protein